jgi:hypothetical protein
MGERELKAYIERLERRVAELEGRLENHPVRIAHGGGGGGITIKFGKLAAEWVAGQNTVTLTPSSEGGSVSGSPEHITATILPGAGHCPCLGAKLNDVLAYVSVGDRHYLFNPPQLPLSELRNHVVTNIAPDGQPAAWRAGFLRGH